MKAFVEKRQHNLKINKRSLRAENHLQISSKGI
jgi:hypothetical protein